MYECIGFPCVWEGFFIFIICSKILLYSPSWTKTCYVDEAGLERTEIHQFLLPGYSNDDFNFHFLNYKFIWSYIKCKIG